MVCPHISLGNPGEKNETEWNSFPKASKDLMLSSLTLEARYEVPEEALDSGASGKQLSRTPRLRATSVLSKLYLFPHLYKMDLNLEDIKRFSFEHLSADLPPDP